MKISEILKKLSKGVAFEFFPPKNEKSKKSLSVTIQALKKPNPLYVSMTYGAGGATQDRTKEAVYMLLKEKNLTVMPHLTCVGAEARGLKELLDEYRKKGIENIMALRGDLPKNKSDFDPSKKDFRYARDLVAFIKKQNHFCVGVAVYPEGHIETSSLEEDMEYTKQKIDAGADFAVTQMFFDNSYYYALLDRMEKKGIKIPVLPGILPLTNIKKIREFASVCRATIPKRIEEKMRCFEDKSSEMEKEGIEFTINQCRDLVKNGAQRIHFFTLNKPGVIKKIIENI